MGALAVICLLFAIYRDIGYQKFYPGDLRNRVVGARLQKDGRSPYFYKWKTGEGTRYYDISNFDSFKVSNITASPFFHDLLYPVVELPQKTIAYLWLIIEYILYLSLVVIAFSMAGTVWQKAAVLLVAISFLFTYAWLGHVVSGQYYLLIPFLIMTCYVYIRDYKSITAAIFAGVFAVSVVLIRPNSVLIFIPLLFITGRFNIRYKVAFLIPVLLFIGYSTASPVQRLYWVDYKNSLIEQLKIHQNLNPEQQKNDRDPGFEKWEGWNKKEIETAMSRFETINHFEQGNVFVIVRIMSGTKLSPRVLSILTVGSILMLILIYFFVNRKYVLTLESLFLLGFSFFMISEFLSPIHRAQYQGVEWLFPLLLIASEIQKKYWIFYVVLGVGIVLNIINLNFMKMEHTIGEYLILIFVLILSFIYNDRYIIPGEKIR